MSKYIYCNCGYGWDDSVESGSHVATPECGEIYDTIPPKFSGKKLDNNKPAIALIPSEAIEEEGKVMGHGEKKYGTNNWRDGLGVVRLLSGVLRHVFACLRGETLDPESGLPHLAHARCGLAMAIWTMQHKPELDDRYKK